MKQTSEHTRRDFLAMVGSGSAALALSALPSRARGAEQEQSPLPAFPGAVGWGARAWGGNTPDLRPVRVELISDLRDYAKNEKPIPGTLRYAVTNHGKGEEPDPSVVMLARQGQIVLKEDLVISKPYTTITGRFSPGAGTVISHGRMVIKTHDIVVTDLVIRPGDFNTGGKFSDRDAVTLWGRKDGEWGRPDSCENILLDRVSASFYCDEGISTYQHCRRISITRSLFSYGLRYTAHDDIDKTKGPDAKNHHSMGILLAPEAREITVHGNVFAYTLHRMPRVMPGSLAEITNNIFYGFGSGTSDKLYIANTKTAPATESPVRIVGNRWIQLEGVSAGAPIASLGGLANLGFAQDPKIRLFFNDNELLDSRGKVLTTTAGIDAKYLLKEDTVPASEHPAPIVGLKDLEATVLGAVGARDQLGKNNAFDADTIDLIRTRKGAIADTVQPEQRALNGFPTTVVQYTYPEEGAPRTMKLPQPAQCVRPRGDQYSILETGLWKGRD